MSSPELPAANGQQDTTIRSLFEELDKWGAAVMTVTMRDHDDAPMGAVIVVKGRAETEEIVGVVEHTQAQWDEDNADE